MSSLFSERYQKELDGIKCWIRPKTSDEGVFKENLEKIPVKKHIKIAPGQKWLDLGGYIGTFALLLIKEGCSVVSAEANPDNAHMYRLNMNLNNIPEFYLIDGAIVYKSPPSGQVRLHVMPQGTRKAELSSGTMFPKWKRSYPTINVGAIEFADVVRIAQDILGPDGDWNLKIDIEGAEIDILSYSDLSCFSQIFWEYHYQVENSLEQAHFIVNRLKELGYEVHLSRKIPATQPTKFYEITHLGWATKRK